MTAVPFDTLKLADRLEAGGFTQQQAHTAASALADVVVGADVVTRADITELATKADLAAGLATVKADLAATKADIAVLALKADLAATKVDLQAGLAELKAEMLKWLISAIGIQTLVMIGAVITLVRMAH